MRATQVLSDEHNGLLTILEVLKKINSKIGKGEDVNTFHLDQIVEFFKVFVDQCHHSKEEVYLFPTIESMGYDADAELIKELLIEHQHGRMLVTGIKESLGEYKAGNKQSLKQLKEHSESYISLLTEHIKKENTMLFPRADNLLPQKEQDEMVEEFEEIENDVIGIGRHEQFHLMIEEMKKIYLA